MSKRKALTNMAEMPLSPIDALLKKLDLLMVEMESKYGAGLLPTLCSKETAAKFIRVNSSLDAAIKSNDYDTVLLKVESLKKGWLKMEQEAKESGMLKPVEAWYVCSPEDGIEYIICKHEKDSSLIVAQNPSKASCVYTLSDIATMIENASVTRLTPKERQYFKDEAKKSKTAFENYLNDEIPF